MVKKNPTSHKGDDLKMTKKDNIENITVKEGMEVHLEKWTFKKIIRFIKKGRLIVDKDFQRDEIYKTPQKSGIIVSAITGKLIPPINVFEDVNYGPGVYSIIDGQQRISSVRDFMLNRYELEILFGELTPLNGYTYEQIQKLNPELADEIGDLTIDVNIIPNISKEEAQEYFGIINTTSVPLSPGEKLWSIHDPVKSVLKSIVQSQYFKVLNFRKSRKGEYVIATKLLWNSLFKNPLNHEFVGNEIKTFIDYFNTVETKDMPLIEQEQHNTLRLLKLYSEIIDNCQYTPRTQSDFYGTMCFISVLDRKNQVNIDKISKFLNWLFRGINKQRYPIRLANDFERLLHHKMSHHVNPKDFVITLEKLYNEEGNSWE